MRKKQYLQINYGGDIISVDRNILSEFIKITNDKTKTKESIPLYGTIITKDGKDYVKMDGSDIATPFRTTIEVKKDDRVVVDVKNHIATVNGNLSDPSSSGDRVDDVEDNINKIELKVKDTEGKVAGLEITSESITSTVKDLDGKYTEIKQTVDGIDITGMVTFNDLSTAGQTTINGANIKTGTLSGDAIYGGLLDGVRVKIDGGAMMTKYSLAGLYVSCAGYMVDSGSSEAIIECGRLDVMKDSFTNSGIAGYASGLAVSSSGSASVAKDVYANSFKTRYSLSATRTTDLEMPNINDLSVVSVDNSYKIKVGDSRTKQITRDVVEQSPYLVEHEEFGIGLDLEAVVASLILSVKELKQENILLKEKLGV